MERHDYTWDDGHPDAARTRLTAETVPRRVVLNAPLLVFDQRDGASLLLIDPHPGGTWETWMLPYASLIMGEEELKTARRASATRHLSFFALAPGDSLADLAAALQEFREAHVREYERALREGLNNVLPDLGGLWTGTPVYENYSLKFSHTSNTYAAYLFSYHKTDSPVSSISVPHTWVEPSDIPTPVAGGPRIHGKKVSSNVVDVLARLERSKSAR